MGKVMPSVVNPSTRSETKTNVLPYRIQHAQNAKRTTGLNAQLREMIARSVDKQTVLVENRTNYLA